MIERQSIRRWWTGQPRLEARSGPILFALVLAGAGLVRLYGLADADFWLDELHSLVNSAARRAAFEALPHGDILSSIVTFDAIPPEIGAGDVWRGMRSDTHPPIYFVFLHVWRRCLGDGEFAVRLPSVLFSLGAMVFTGLTVRRWGGWPSAVAAVCVSALGFASLLAAQDARPYALAAFFLSMSYWSFARCFVDGDAPRSAGQAALLFAYVLSSVLALLTHYFSAAALAGQIPFAAAYLRGRRLAFGAGAAFLVGILFGGVWFPSLLAQLPIIRSYEWIDAHEASHAWNTILRLADAPTRLLFQHAPFRLSLSSSALGLILIGSCMVLAARRDRRVALLLGGWCITPLLILAITDLGTLKETLKHLRYVSLAAPGLAALLGWSWMKISRRVRQVSGGVFALAVLLTLRLPTPDNPHNQTAARYIAEASEPRSLVVFHAVGWPRFWTAQMYHNVAHYLQRQIPPESVSVLLLRDPPAAELLAKIAGFERLIVVSPWVEADPNPMPGVFYLERRSPYVHQIGFVYAFRREAHSSVESGSEEPSSSAINPTTQTH